MKLISIRQNPDWAERATAYFQAHWANEDSKMVYDDCIHSCLDSDSPLPQWYLLCDGDEIIGCAGLITNDFISRMDLWPWLCALYVEKAYRGHAYGNLLIDQIKEDVKALGYANLYLCTDLSGYYEQYDFTEIDTGYHPWGESSKIYQAKL